MDLEFEKQTSDARGTIIFLKYGQKKINIVEIKKGFSRGGHYHTFDTKHFIIYGTIEYREKNLKTGQEKIEIITAPSVVKVPAMVAHLLTAQEDTIFAEEFMHDYSATDYPEYRKLVTQNIS